MQYLQLYCVLALLNVLHPVHAQSNYTSYAESALQTLQGWYNSTSGLWDTAGWWNGANCMTVIADLAAVDNDVLATATSVFASTYTLAPPQNPSNNLYKVSRPGFIRTYYEAPPFNTTINNRRDVDSREEAVPELPSSVSSIGDDGDLEVLRPRATLGGNAAGFLDSCYDDNSWWALGWIAAYDLTQNQDYLDTAIGIFGNLTGSWPTTCANGGIYW